MTLQREIEKSFPKIEKLLTKEMLQEFSQSPADELEKYNLGLGTMIRLKLLRPESVLYKKFVHNGFSDRKEMAMEMIRAFHKHVNPALE